MHNLLWPGGSYKLYSDKSLFVLLLQQKKYLLATTLSHCIFELIYRTSFLKRKYKYKWMTEIFIFSGKAHKEKPLIITWKKKKIFSCSHFRLFRQNSRKVSFNLSCQETATEEEIRSVLKYVKNKGWNKTFESLCRKIRKHNYKLFAEDALEK